MEQQKHPNLRDVGLSLRRLRLAGLAAKASWSPGQPESWWLPGGKLLRCGAVDQCSVNELRRPKTIVNLRMGPDPIEAAAGSAPLQLHIPAANDLEKYDTANKEVQAWLQAVVAVFAREDVELPVLLHCRSGRDRTGVAVAALLLVLGVPEPLVLREYLLSDGAEEKFLRKSFTGFRRAGGVEAYLSKGGVVDVERVRSRLLGSKPAAASAVEVAWLQQELPILCRLVREEHAAAAYWAQAVSEAAQALAASSTPVGGEVSAALFYWGWALGQLGEAEEATMVLSTGVALASRFGAKQKVVEKLEKELESLQCERPYVMAAQEAIDTPGDPHVGLVLLDVEEIEGVPRWRALRCPDAFSWLRCGELAMSATPQSRHLPALERLGLSQRAFVEPLGRSRPLEQDVEDTIAQAARALASGSGCLLHCDDGFAGCSIVGACFLVLHGLDAPLPKDGAAVGKPQMTAGEAVDLIRSWRPGSLSVAEDEDQVYAFAQSAWGRHVERAQRAFCRPAASTASATSSATGSSAAAASRKPAPSGARVVKQPGDGNCLFHSMAYALGGSATTLRTEICSFMANHPSLDIAGTSLSDWIQMLAGEPLHQYAKKMAKGAQWGGAPEIAACAHMRHVNIHVYEKKGSGFDLMVPFDVDGAGRTVTVLYVGGVHYDALVMP